MISLVSRCWWLLVISAAAGFPAPSSANVSGTILVVGDSLSAAYGIAAEEGWVALLQSRLADEGYGYEVINASITGDTTRGGRARLPAALDRHAPDIVVIELGGNDGLRGIPVAEMKTNLAAMIEAARNRQAEVVLLAMKIPPNYGPAYTRDFTRAFSDLAARYELPEPPFLLEKVALDDGLFLPDGIHPNAEAQPIMLTNVWPALQAVLPDAPCAGAGGQEAAGGP